MKPEEHNNSFVQCQYCGYIYVIEENDENKIDIDELIIDSICPKCSYSRALNCGNSEDEVYRYMNESLDPRYYLY